MLKSRPFSKKKKINVEMAVKPLPSPVRTTAVLHGQSIPDYLTINGDKNLQLFF